MPNTRETVRALINAFNVYNYGRNTVKTNFTLQSDGNIVVSFDKGMSRYQCSEYLYNIKRKIIREFYGIEESNDAEILDTAKLIFDVNSFPFDISKGDWSGDEQNGYKFVTPIDQGVIFNLKSHLASSLRKDVLENMRISSTTIASNKKKYLWHDEFDNKELRKKFESEFLLRMRERYENVPKNPLKVEGDSVYIKDVFDDARFIDSVTRRVAWLVGMYLGVDSSANHKVKLFKDMIVESISQSTGVTIHGFVCASPLSREEASVLIPLILDSGRRRILTNEEALKLNYAFNGAILNDIDGKAQGELSVNGDREKYGIDFSNPEISYSVITKIIENSVINKDHELSIDPELVRALSPAQSPVKVPNGPSSYLTESLSPTQESPTWNQDVADGSPRRGSEEKEETGGDFQLLPGGEIGQTSASSQQTNHLSSPPSAEFSSCSSSGSSSSRGADKSGSAWTSQPIGFWSSPTPSAGPSLWQPSRPLLRKGANESGSAWTSQPIGFWSSPTLSAGPSLWQPSGPSSSESANKSMRTGNSTWYGVPSSHSPGVEDVNSVEPEKQQVSDEYSEAKSQESKSPEKQHGGGWFCKERKKLSSFKRHSAERDTMCSSKSDLVHCVTEKPPVSKPFFSFPTRIKAKSNPPSEVTSPTHEGVPEWQQRLDPDQRKELRPFLSPELKKKLDTNSFSPEEEQRLYLMLTPSGKREIKNSFEPPEENLRRSVNAQLPSSDNLDSKKVNRDSGFGSMGSASPAVPHKGSVSSELKHLQQVKHMSEALRK